MRLLLLPSSREREKEINTLINSIPTKTTAVTTPALPKKRIKSPTELIAMTRKALLDSILKARPADQQKFSP
jgi:hypothetical protein